MNEQISEGSNPWKIKILELKYLWFFAYLIRTSLLIADIN